MEQLTYYDKKRNEWIDSLEENEENDKNIENYENVADTGKRVMNKLNSIILGFNHHMESIEKEKTRQFEEIMRKKTWVGKTRAWTRIRIKENGNGTRI